MSLFLPVLHGTVREASQSRNVARWVVGELARRPDVETRLFDPRELSLGNLNLREWEIPEPGPALRSFVVEMDRADGFVVVLPEYNRGIPGALKNLLDHLYDEWNRKPFGIISTGATFGGIRGAEQLREIVGGLSGIPIPGFLAVPDVWESFGPDGPRTDPSGWREKFETFAQELEWYARALRFARKAPNRLALWFVADSATGPAGPKPIPASVG